MKNKKRKRFLKITALVLAVLIVPITLYFLFGRIVTPLPQSKNSSFSADRDFDISGAIESVPEDYFKSAGAGGTIEALEYKTKTSAKTAIVYLPPNYDENSQYDIIYFQGGAGSDEEYFFGTPESPKRKFRNMLDNMIQNGEIKPIIAVCADFYGEEGIISASSGHFSSYGEEVRECLVPAVESKYSTYAASTDDSDLVASRAHRAFGGYSMGAAITWGMFIHNLDYFYYYIPNCGGMQNPYTLHFSTNLGSLLNATVEEKGYTPADYFIYSAVGTWDITYNSTTRLINDLSRHYKNNFIFTQDNTKNGNITFKKKPFAVHGFDNATTNFYNALRAMFPA